MITVRKRLNSDALQGIITLPKELQQCGVEVTVRKADGLQFNDLSSLYGIAQECALTDDQLRSERLLRI